ncbi:MAG: LPS assembly lipoprotein LptE [Candidatus Omnitrophica bacterium]|nr:LPS assembly lipoprotein LptE [Candidatus Omnitrophota bacterium]
MIAVFIMAGCGYTTQSLLPSDIKSIRVDNFKNRINVAAEQSNVRMYRGYRPGMEIEITTAVINKFLTDGTLKIASAQNADLILTGELIDFNRGALRYDTNENIEEYRIKLIVNIEVRYAKTGELMWSEKGFAGETTYMTTGGLARSENAAVASAIEDLARRIVERTVEVW